MKAAEKEKQHRALTVPRPLAIRNKFKPVPRKRAGGEKEEKDVAKAAAVPLPPSPGRKTGPTEVPLPPSRPASPPPLQAQDAETPNEAEEINDAEAKEIEEVEDEIEVESEAEEESASLPPLVHAATTPRHPVITSIDAADVGKTPISSLVAAIQRGFLATPASPLSPPSVYGQAGEPWTGWPAGMGAFAQGLPVIKDEQSYTEADEMSPKTEAKWLKGLIPVMEEDSFCRPALVERDMN